MKAVHFGAGKIGRGFIADLLHQTGYDIVFVDVNQQLNEELNRYHNYYVYMIEDNYERKEIDRVSAFSPITQKEQVLDNIAEAALITTAVLADNFSKIAPVLAEGLKRRLSIHAPKINVIPCENALLCGDKLKKAILDTGILMEEELGEAAAIPNTAVDRMVFDTDKDGRKGIDIGRDYELVVQRDMLVSPDEKPICGAIYTDELKKYLERKLYVINGGHAWAGYMAHLMGYKIIQDYFADEKNVADLKAVMRESSALLEKKFGFTHEEMLKYIDFAVNRFLTPGVVDTVARISRAPIRKLGREDRLVGPALQCEEYGLSNEMILKGIAAVFLFDEETDEQSVELRKYVKEFGICEAIKKYIGISEDTVVFEKIRNNYYELQK